MKLARLLLISTLPLILCDCAQHEFPPHSWESAHYMPDTYMLVGFSETHGHAMFNGDLKRMEDHRRNVAEGFWGYFTSVYTLDGLEHAMRSLRFCIRKHGLNSALITPAPANRRPPGVDAEIDRLLLTNKNKTPYLLRITSDPCDLERVRRFRSGANLTADGLLKD